MSTCTYTVEENGVAIMTIANPPMNALKKEVIQDIKSAVEKAESDDAVRVVIFTGEGRAFIAGADITEFVDVNEKVSAAGFVKIGQDVLNTIENSTKPYIAAINGFALGGGMEVALACHIRLADETAQVGLPEIGLGIIPGYGGTQRLPRLIGKGLAYELILTGEFITAEKAAQYGIVNRVTAKGEVLEEAKKLAKSIARKGRPAVVSAMKVIKEGMEGSLEDGLKLEREEFGVLCETENKVEGVAAFMEKRKPVAKDK